MDEIMPVVSDSVLMWARKWPRWTVI